LIAHDPMKNGRRRGEERGRGETRNGNSSPTGGNINCYMNNTLYEREPYILTLILSRLQKKGKKKKGRKNLCPNRSLDSSSCVEGGERRKEKCERAPALRKKEGKNGKGVKSSADLNYFVYRPKEGGGGKQKDKLPRGNAPERKKEKREGEGKAATL